MLFQRINRTDAEKIFIICQNVSGSTVTAGYSVVFDTGASVNGVRVTKCETTDMQAFAGVADEDIANNGYGRIQVYGYRSSVYITSSAGSSVVGDNLYPVGDAWGLRPADSGATAKAFGFLCEAITASAASSTYTLNAKAFIRAL
jgi:hypothetical protein